MLRPASKHNAATKKRNYAKTRIHQNRIFVLSLFNKRISVVTSLQTHHSFSSLMRFVDICYHCSAETHITFCQSTNYTRDNKESKVTSHCPHNIRAGNSHLKKRKLYACMLVTVTYSKRFCIVWCFGFGIIRLSYSILFRNITDPGKYPSWVQFHSSTDRHWLWLIHGLPCQKVALRTQEKIFHITTTVTAYDIYIADSDRVAKQYGINCWYEIALLNNYIGLLT